MHAAIQTSGNVFACPVLVVGPGFQGQVIESAQPGRTFVCPVCRDTVGVTFGDVQVVARGRAAGFDLLDPADAGWEDAEWM